MTPESTLHLIHKCLTAEIAPTELIEQMQPQSMGEAMTWARRLTLFDEYRVQFPGQVVALARTIARKAITEHGLTITEDGRVIEGTRNKKTISPPTACFIVHIGGEQVRVEYTRDYLPSKGTDYFQFRSPHEPAQPTPLSDTGWWSHFAHCDAVEVCDGPEAYAVLLAAAKIGGRIEEFDSQFEGNGPRRLEKRLP